MKENIFLKHKLKRYNNKEEYLIDIKLRAFLLEILEHIEDSLKQSFIDEVWENYDNIDFYRAVFKNDVKEFIERKIKYLKENNEECLNIKWRIEVNIFISKLTFWEISHLLRKLNIKNKKNILKQFWFYKLRFFENWISNIRYLRNLVCHWENIFNRKYEKKIDFYNTAENNNNFKWYFLILWVFCKILGIEEKIKNIWKFLQKKKDAPGVKHISKEIEAWYVLVDTLYDFYVKKSNLNWVEMNIIQFLPYFPPHKWGLETHAKEWGDNWNRKWYWKVINITTNIWTEYKWKDKVIKIEEDNWNITYYLPSIEIISNFPVYKFWKKNIRNLFKELWKDKDNFIITRTRFFLTSFIWWVFSEKNKLKWIHIEHWSDYVKLNSKFKSFIAYMYDKIIWKWIFRNSDLVIPISTACKDFILKLWWIKIKLWPVIYRWFGFINLVKENKLDYEIEEVIKVKEWKKEWKIILWFVWRLYKWKWVENIIQWLQKIKSEDNKNIEKIKFVIVWDGEDLERLKKLTKKFWLEKYIYFTWWKNFKEALFIQSQFDIHIHSSLPWWWLSWTLVQWMYLAPIIISSINEGAKEIIWEKKAKAILIWNKENYSIDDMKNAIKNWIEYFKKWEDFRKINKWFIESTFDWNKNIEKYYLEFKKLNNG